MSSALRLPEVDQWSRNGEGPLATAAMVAAPRGVKDLLRQRRGSSGEGKRPTTSSSQPVTPPIMPGHDDGRADGRCSQKRGVRISAPERPDCAYEVEPEPEPAPETDREREERERRRRRRRRRRQTNQTYEGEGADVSSRTLSGPGRQSRQRTPDCPVVTADKQSPRARKVAQKAAQEVAQYPKDEAYHASDVARSKRCDQMQKGRKRGSRNSNKQQRSCQTLNAVSVEDTAADRGAATSAQIRLLVETESTQTDDDLLQELLRRRRAYLNEQSQLDGRESASVVKAKEEADEIFAQATQRARDEAMKTIDASICLKAALWNGSQHSEQLELAVPRSSAQAATPNAEDSVPAVRKQAPQYQVELTPQATTVTQCVDTRGIAASAKHIAAGAAVPVHKNTRGFRLRR